VGWFAAAPGRPGRPNLAESALGCKGGKAVATGLGMLLGLCAGRGLACFGLFLATLDGQPESSRLRAWFGRPEPARCGCRAAS